MKTLKEWLDELPAPYRAQAWANHRNNVVNAYGSSLTFEYKKMSEAIGGAFIWDKSPEGVVYWITFQRSLKLQGQ